MENKDTETFNYTYSAKQQEEIKEIRKKYAQPEEENKMEQLRRLDGAVTKKASTTALVIGVIGALIMGIGMSLAMTEIGVILGSDNALAMTIGVVVGVIGIILVASAYPAYNRILKKERERIVPEIIRLTDELMK